MRFKLREQTVRMLEESTGRKYESVVSRPMSKNAHGKLDSASYSAYASENNRIIPPRGSVYLQTGRILPYEVVRQSLFESKRK